MALKSTTDRYGTAAITIHWVSALLILLLFGTGITTAQISDEAIRQLLLRIHAPIGAAILLLTLFRLLWWVKYDSKPSPLSAHHWQILLAKWVHLLVYFAIIVAAASGIAMFILSGAGPVVFGGNPADLPDFWAFAPRYGHRAAAILMIALFVLHSGAASYHHFILRDPTLRRMWYRRSENA